MKKVLMILLIVVLLVIVMASIGAAPPQFPDAMVEPHPVLEIIEPVLA